MDSSLLRAPNIAKVAELSPFNITKDIMKTDTEGKAQIDPQVTEDTPIIEEITVLEEVSRV
ncbi:hypothetical protein ACTXT7_011351 [Hymenolepis weldensis]